MNHFAALCKFSPLRTPDVQNVKKKAGANIQVPSDTESTVSVTTLELRSLAKTVTTKMAMVSAMESSDEDLFITQKTFRTESSDKIKSKSKIKEKSSSSSSDSDLSLSDSSEDNEVPTKEQKTKTSDSTKKKTNADEMKDSVTDCVETSSLSEDSTAESTVILDLSKLQAKANNNIRNSKKHDMSDLDISSDDDSNALTSKQTKHAVKRKGDMSHAQSEVSQKKRVTFTKETVSERGRSSDCDGFIDPAHKPKAQSAQKKSKKSDSSKISSLSDSKDDDRNTKINKVSSEFESSKKSSSSKHSNKTSDSEKHTDKSSSSVHSHTKKSKINGISSPNKKAVNPKKRHMSDKSNQGKNEEMMEEDKTGGEGAGKEVNKMGDAPAIEAGLRYAIPENFAIDKTKHIVDRADLQDEEVFLITAPSDFDISTLDGLKLNLNGTHIIKTGDEDEKHYEIKCVPKIQEERSSVCTLMADKNRSKVALTVGPDLRGHIFVMPWIPTMPSIVLNKTKREKHRVPDDLKQTFKPFGSSSPERENMQPETLHKSHKKSKKAKNRNKDISNSMDLSMQEEKSAGETQIKCKLDKTDDDFKTDYTQGRDGSEKKKKKKHKKHKNID